MGRGPVAGRPTLQQVAERAGVSVATASRALAQRGRVASATQVAVNRAARALGYLTVPRNGAIGTGDELVQQRVGIVAVGLRGQFTGHVVEGVEAMAADTAGCVVTTTGGDPARERRRLRALLRDATIGGVVVIGGLEMSAADTHELVTIVDEYARSGKRLVFCGRSAVGDRKPERVVDYDNRGGARTAMTYLLGHGHRDILFVRGPEGYPASDARAAGYADACAAFGITPNEQRVRVVSRDRRGGYAATQAALADGTHFTAILGECDWIAVGALAALADAALDVPGDISVMGFDDMWLCEDLRVPLTTVHVPFREIGNAAADMVLAPDTPNRDLQRVAGTHLVVRASVAPLR